MRFESRSLWVAKDTELPQYYEDAFCLDAERGTAAIADGVSEGIFSGQWARILTADHGGRAAELGRPAGIPGLAGPATHRVGRADRHQPPGMVSASEDDRRRHVHVALGDSLPERLDAARRDAAAGQLLAWRALPSATAACSTCAEGNRPLVSFAECAPSSTLPRA